MWSVLNISDEVLVAHAKDGNQSAFGVLFLRYKGEIYACLMKIVRNDENAKDLWQDTYLKAWKGIQSLNDPSRFKPWVVSIARNLAFDWLRQYYREMTNLSEGIVPDAINDEAGPEIIIEKEYVRYVLAKMEPTLREVLLLSTEYSQAEIAHLLGYKKNTVTTYLSKARKQFRHIYRMIDNTDEN